MNQETLPFHSLEALERGLDDRAETSLDSAEKTLIASHLSDHTGALSSKP
jgi:hypothetical protein